MTHPNRTAALLGVFLATSVTFANPAPPADPNDTHEACRSDAIHLCPDPVSARDHAGTRACLRDHWQQVSEQCKAAVAAKRQGKTGA